MIRKFSIVALISLGLNMACSRPDTEYLGRVPEHSERSKVDYKNFTLNKQMTASVGEPMVKIKGYMIEDAYVNEYVIGEPFELIINDCHFRYIKGDRIKPYGLVRRKGKVQSEFLVSYPGFKNDNDVHIGVDMDGSIVGIADQWSASWLTWSEVNVKVRPQNYRLPNPITKETIASPTNKNFEIIYSGLDSSGLHAVYREYTPDDYAKQAFYQDLTFPASSERIRFRNYLIKIHSANSEGINYTVISE